MPQCKRPDGSIYSAREFTYTLWQMLGGRYWPNEEYARILAYAEQWAEAVRADATAPPCSGHSGRDAFTGD